ncbi:septum formation family protein [Nocardioides sp.]|uniref:septum formation family protein n=1 Tax=Nocardioides sp. TaxID=35761 RepID=UPI00262FF5CF|nr:septum formation family protein [Nocardioides sp.]
MRLRALHRSVLPALLAVALLAPDAAGAQRTVGDPPATTTAEPTAAPEPEPTAEPDPMAGAPTVGTCADMTWAEAMGETATEAVDCARRHTTEVVGVGQLPAELSWEQWRRAGEAVVAACAPAWETVTTADHLLYRRSAYEKFWFMPSEEQRAAGARWFRCDLARVKGQKLMVVTGAGLPVVTPKLSKPVRRCMTKDFYGTVCKNKRRLVGWRNKEAFWLPVPANDSRAERKVRRAALERCPDRVRTRQFAWSWFTDEDRRWVVLCYERV